MVYPSEAGMQTPLICLEGENMKCLASWKISQVAGVGFEQFSLAVPRKDKIENSQVLGQMTRFPPILVVHGNF